MKRLFLLFIFVSLLLTVCGKVKAQAVDCVTERCATCDLCGYCLGANPAPPAQNPPADWEACRNCLYPDITSPAEDNETLRIDQTNNNGPTPFPGSWYTMIGCVSTNIGSFTGQGAAGGVVQTLLNLIFGIAGGIAFLYILYGAFIILTSSADIERLNYGRRVIFGAIIGIIFSLSAVFLVNLIGGGILKIPGFGN